MYSLCNSNIGVMDVDFGQVFHDDNDLNLTFNQSYVGSDSKSVTSCSTSSTGKSKKNKQVIVSPNVKVVDTPKVEDSAKIGTGIKIKSDQILSPDGIKQCDTDLSNNTFLIELIPQSLTSSQLAAVSATNTVHLHFPPIEAFPAQIGGVWCDGGGDSDTEDIDDGDNTDKKRKRLSKPVNPDADLIFLATEECIKTMNIDPNSKEGKKQRKLVRNRMSAQMHRERKKAYITYLENIIRHRESVISSMQNKLTYLSKENEILHKNKPESSNISSNYTTSSDVDTSDAVSISSGDTIAPLESVVNIEEPDKKKYRTTVSFFSLIFMVAFTLFASPKSPAPFADKYPLVPSISAMNSIDTTYNLPNPSNNWPLIASPIIFNDASDFTRVQDEQPSAILSLDSPEDKNNRNIIRSTNAIWKFQDKVVQLFPNVSNTQDKLRIKKRNLRNGYSNNDDKRALIPSYTQNADMGSFHGHTSSSISSSKVLITQGQALLHPALSIGMSNDYMKQTTKTASNPDVKSDTSVSTTALSPYYGGASSSPTAPKALLSISSSDDAPQESNDNMLLMILPANQVRWGKSVSDSLSMETLLNNSNFTSNGDTAQADDMWVEIGCAVFKAQLVKNVTLI